jgi:hypothetical protein
MLRIGIGHSEAVDVEEVVAELLDAAMADLGGLAPAAGLLFAAADSAFEEIVAALRRAQPGLKLIGATTDAEMSSRAGYLEGSVALALFASDRLRFGVGFADGLVADPAGACARAVAAARADLGAAPALCFALPDGGVPYPADVVSALRAALGDVPLVGGGAAPIDVTAGWKTHQFCNDRVATDGVPVLLIGGPLALGIGVATGWRPVGRRGRVTASDGAVVREIDGAPALAFYESYLGRDAPTTVATPLAIHGADGKALYLRAPLAADKATGALTFFGGIPEGAEVQIAYAGTADILAGARESLDQARAAFPAGAAPEAALVVSCAVRRMSLGRHTGQECDLVREVVGASVPVLGYYAFGEIAPGTVGGAAVFHNETFVTLLMGTA